MDAPDTRADGPRRRSRAPRTGAASGSCASTPRTVWGGLEDDFHHFEVTLTHDGHAVTGIAMEARRWPWATCPDAGPTSRSSSGMELSDRCTAVAAVSDPHWQCTHQFDLAGLCVAHAARGTERVASTRSRSTRVTTASAPQLWRDGELLLEWTSPATAPGRVLVDPPPPFDGRTLEGRLHPVGRRDAAPVEAPRRRSCCAAPATSAWAAAWTSRRSTSARSSPGS